MQKEVRQREAIKRWFMLWHPLRAFPEDVEAVVAGMSTDRLPVIFGNCLRILRERKVRR